jgi:hypothetical protein
VTYDTTKNSENARSFEEQKSEVNDHRLSDEGKRERLVDIEKEQADRHEQLYKELDEGAAHEVEKARRAVYGLTYPSSTVITERDKDGFREKVRNTRLSLANLTDDQVEEQMRRALSEGSTDRVLLQSLYLESLHRSEGDGAFNKALGLQGGAAFTAAEAYRNATPDARKKYDKYLETREQYESPVGLFQRGLAKSMGPAKDNAYAEGDAGAFLADLFGNRR